MATKENNMITTPKVAYKAGFSDSMRDNVYSAYQEILRWEFCPGNIKKLHRTYYRGFREGFELKMAVKKDLVAGRMRSDDAAVATLRSSEFNN